MYVFYLSEAVVLLFVLYLGLLLWKELGTKRGPVESANVGCIAGALLPFTPVGILIAAVHLWLSGGRSLFAILDMMILAAIVLVSMVAIEKRIPHFFLGDPEMNRSRKKKRHGEWKDPS